MAAADCALRLESRNRPLNDAIARENVIRRVRGEAPVSTFFEDSRLMRGVMQACADAPEHLQGTGRLNRLGRYLLSRRAGAA